MNLFYIFSTRFFPGERLAEGCATSAEEFLEVARKVLETNRAEDIFVNVWDATTQDADELQ